MRITARGWGWRYAGRREWALRELDLTIGSGERVLLAGPSGAGKSTLLLALAGVLGEADEGEQVGELLIDGLPPGQFTGRAALVQQDPESQVILSRVGDDVAFGPENLAVPREQIWPIVRESLDAVGLMLPLSHPTAQLSGGRKQRLALAGALAMHRGGQQAGPGLLLLDEPTANLDPQGALEVRRAVDAVTAGGRQTLIVVEHHVDLWVDLIDRVVVLDPAGGTIADGPPEQVFRTHREALLAAGTWLPGVPVDLRPRPAAPATEALLSTEALAIGYRGRPPVQQDLELRIPRGQSSVVTGANGAGKTTLAMTLAGLRDPLHGRVVAATDLRPPALAGWRRRSRDPAQPQNWSSTELLTRIGTVFQQPGHQFVTANVRAELAVGLLALGRRGAGVTARVDELLDLLHLDGLAGANPFTLSGGEQRRLSVGTVLATGPALIVLDEPTFGQDRITWTDLVRLIMTLLDQGSTVLSVTHDQNYLDLLGQHRIALPAAPDEAWSPR